MAPFSAPALAPNSIPAATENRASEATTAGYIYLVGSLAIPGAQAADAFIADGGLSRVFSSSGNALSDAGESVGGGLGADVGEGENVASESNAISNNVAGCFRAGTEVLGSTGLSAIESIVPGRRVITGSGDTAATSITQQTHRLVRLQFVKDGVEYNMAFLRSVKLLEGLGAGDFMELSVLELQIRGRARVVSVEPCPPIEQGIGRVVTGAFSSQSCDIRLIKLQGLGKPLEATGNHPIFSEDRLDFVLASELRPGEQLRAYSGVAAVQSIEKRCGKFEVFNLEIDGAHRYYVSEQCVLVHNANGLITQPNGDVVFQGMTVEVQEPLDHLTQEQLEDMAEIGKSPFDQDGELIVLHHVGQNPAGPLWELKKPLHNVNNLDLHPFGNAEGVGLTPEERAAFGAWRTAYWRARANQELALRRLFPQGVGA